MAEERSIDQCWYKDVCTQECSSSCIRFLEMSYLIDNSNIPLAKQMPKSLYPDGVDVEAFNELADIKDHIYDFVSKGNDLYIASKYNGNGKTTWAIKLLLKYFNEVWAGNGFRIRGMFIHTPTFLLRLKDFKSTDLELDEFKRNLLKADVVVWDEIGSDYLSNYDLTQLLTFLDQRDLNELSNIYTGNLLDSDLNAKVGPKLYSRIWNSSHKIILNSRLDRRVV